MRLRQTKAVCVYPVRKGSTFFGDQRVKIFCIELKPVRRVSTDITLKRFQQNVLKARRKPPLNMGEFRVAQLIASVNM